MREQKNIDRLFQENLKEFEVFPPNKAWNKIEKNLIPVPKKPFYKTSWFRISSIAAAIILLFTVSTIFILPKDNFTTTNFIKKDTIKNTPEEVVKKVVDSKKVIKKAKTSPIEKKEGKKVDKGIDIEILEEIVDNNTTEPKSLPKLNLAKAEKQLLKAPEEKVNVKDPNSKFTVATIYAPIYLNSFGDGSGVGEQFGDSPISGNSSYSYGVKFAYQLNKKIAVQSGVNLLNMGYTTNNVYVQPGVAVLGVSNLSTQPLGGTLAARSIDGNLESKAVNKNNIGSVNQVFGYVEIPVEIKYNVADGKLGVNVVGGFSTLLLNRDEVFVQTNDFSQSLGESNNLRSVNFSGNFGLDVDYSIHKNLYINVSPMFKVQTNTFSKNSGSVLPYYLGVYTGLNYKF